MVGVLTTLLIFGVGYCAGWIMRAILHPIAKGKSPTYVTVADVVLKPREEKND